MNKLLLVDKYLSRKTITLFDVIGCIMYDDDDVAFILFYVGTLGRKFYKIV